MYPGDSLSIIPFITGTTTQKAIVPMYVFPQLQSHAAMMMVMVLIRLKHILTCLYFIKAV